MKKIIIVLIITLFCFGCAKEDKNITINIYENGEKKETIETKDESKAQEVLDKKEETTKDSNETIKDESNTATNNDASIDNSNTKEEKSKLVCILSSSEFYKLKAIIHEVDPKAFFYVVRASEVSGEGFTRK